MMFVDRLLAMGDASTVARLDVLFLRTILESTRQFAHFGSLALLEVGPPFTRRSEVCRQVPLLLWIGWIVDDRAEGQDIRGMFKTANRTVTVGMWLSHDVFVDHIPCGIRCSATHNDLVPKTDATIRYTGSDSQYVVSR